MNKGNLATILALMAGLCLVLGIHLIGYFLSHPQSLDESDPLLTLFMLGFVLVCGFILILIAILLGSIATENVRAQRKKKQEQRDKFAEWVATEIERCTGNTSSDAHIPPFVLYLRPFSLEQSIRERKGQAGFFWVRAFLSEGRMNFDYILQSYLDPLNIPLISIGLPNDQEGAGHLITTDNSWRVRFRVLAERATTIVVVPGIQPGIISEIRWLIVSGLLVNAVFFKPTGYLKTEWEKMKEKYENEEEIELPDYSANQLSFRMYSSGRYYDVLMWRKLFWFLGRGWVPADDQMRALLTNKPIK